MPLDIGLLQKKSEQLGLRTWTFQGHWKKCMWNFQGSTKKEVEFLRVMGKNNVKLPWVLVFDFGISKGSHINLQNFQGWKLSFSGISRGKVINLKIPGGFQKTISLNPRLDVSVIVHSFSSALQNFFNNKFCWSGKEHNKTRDIYIYPYI